MVSRSLRPAALAFALVALFLFYPSFSRAAPRASISLSSPYTQNFDTLATSGTANPWTNDSTLPGWYAAQQNGALTTYRAGDGSTTNGALYSFGTGTNTERALGSVSSGTPVTIFYGARFVNDTGNNITSLTVGYTGEQWRNGGNTAQQKLAFEYQIDAAGLVGGAWTAETSLDFTSPITGATASPLDGNASANRTAIGPITITLSIAAGQEVWIRWTDINDAGNDHGLGIDDLTVSSTNSPGDAAPTVTGTSPANGATNVAVNAPVTVTFSEPVSVTGTINIVCTGGTQGVAPTGGPTTWNLPHTDFGSGDSCSITIPAAQVTDVDVNDPPDNLGSDYAWSFSVQTLNACLLPATLIHDVQGAGATSPISGTVGTTVQGVVVGDYQNTTTEFSGFFVQEEDADADGNPATSEGLFIFDNGGPAVAVGDLVRVTGTVAEYYSSGQALTELKTITNLVVCSTGGSVTSAVVTLPVAAVSDLERYEGMQVTISGPLTVNDNYTLGRYGEVSLAANGQVFQFTHLNAPSVSGNAAYLDEVARRTIILDDGNNQQNRDPILYPDPGGLSASNTLRTGDTTASVTGILDQRFGVYRLQPVGTVSFTHSNARPASVPSTGSGLLRVAGVNMLNYFTTTGSSSICGPSHNQACRGASNGTEFTRQQTKLVQELKGLNADVLGLMEIENDSSDGPVQNLVTALNNAISGTDTAPYDYVRTGSIGTDAIRVALIYKPDSFETIGSPMINSDATFSRPPLAQTFQDDAHGRFTVVVNHFKSKGSCPTDGSSDEDQGDGQGCWNAKRTAQASLLLTWLNDTVIPAARDSDVLILGDLNAYAKEDPVTTLKNGGYSDLVSTYVGAAGYSYGFDGQLGYLDHALASASLAGQVTGAGEWHINADEPVALDYNTEFKSAGQQASLYASDPYRASDHDPVVVGIGLQPDPYWYWMPAIFGP